MSEVKEEQIKPEAKLSNGSDTRRGSLIPFNANPDTGEEGPELTARGLMSRPTGYDAWRRPLQFAKSKESFDGNPRNWSDYRWAFRMWIGTHNGPYYELLEVLDFPEEELMLRYGYSMDKEAQEKLRSNQK